jgi:hypothetical protein
MAYNETVGGSAGRADRGDRERSLDWDQRPATERLGASYGASYMRFSARAARGVAGRRNAHPRPSCVAGLQEIMMLTLIEETGPRISRSS